MINTFNEFSSGLRGTILTIVIGLTWVVNIVFAAFSLGDPLSIYTLLVFLIVLYILSLLLEHTLISDADINEALTLHIFPARIRTPLRVGYTPYIGVWLGWWFVTQLFFSAGIVFEYGYITQLLLLPLVIAALSVNCGLVEAPAYVRRYVLVMLLIVTTIALFFPTRAWAPQHVNPLHTVVRVIVFFSMIMLNDSVTPANVYANLSTEHTAVRASPRASLREHMARTLEDGTAEMRREKINSIIEAYARIDDESARVSEFIALTAWLLVTPLAAVLLMSVLAVAATFYSDRRKVARIAAQAAQKEHALPPSPPPSMSLLTVPADRLEHVVPGTTHPAGDGSWPHRRSQPHTSDTPSASSVATPQHRSASSAADRPLQTFKWDAV